MKNVCVRCMRMILEGEDYKREDGFSVHAKYDDCRLAYGRQEYWFDGDDFKACERTDEQWDEMKEDRL